MITTLLSSERGHADHGWLQSFHTFSFANYHNPNRMGFRSLRVINEDKLAAGTGFSTHAHKNMEIISYVAAGALEHKDSLGNSGIIRPGEVQYMSAGSGVEHSEFNHLKDTDTHLLQIWILPDQQNSSPRYGQKSFEKDLLEKNLVLTVSKNGRDGSIAIHQDAEIFAFKKLRDLGDISHLITFAV